MTILWANSGNIGKWPEIHKITNKIIFLHYMAVGRVGMGQNTSYRMWEQLSYLPTRQAHLLGSFLKDFFLRYDQKHTNKWMLFYLGQVDNIQDMFSEKNK